MVLKVLYVLYVMYVLSTMKVVTMMNLVDGMYVTCVTYAMHVWGHPYSDVNEVNRI